MYFQQNSLSDPFIQLRLNNVYFSAPKPCKSFPWSPLPYAVSSSPIALSLIHSALTILAILLFLIYSSLTPALNLETSYSPKQLHQLPTLCTSITFSWDLLLNTLFKTAKYTPSYLAFLIPLICSIFFFPYHLSPSNILGNLFIVYYLLSHWNVSSIRTETFALFKHLVQCVIHNRCLLFVEWMNEWTDI